MTIKKVSVIFFMVVVTAMTGAASVKAQQGPYAYREGEVLVKYKTSRTPIEKSALHTAGLVRSSHVIGNSQIHRVALMPGTTVEQALNMYAEDPDVEIAEPNYLIYPQAVPNDTGFSNQWGLYNTGQSVNGSRGQAGIDLDALRAWDITTDGSEVIVAVLDTGSNFRHLDLAANIWRNPGEIAGDGVDNDNNGFIDDVHGWDFADNNNDPSDVTGHGTHVAGIIAAQGNNQRGISGVAWRARIMPVRIMNGFDVGTTAHAINAIQYAVANGAKIINCSWGSASYSSALRQAITRSSALFVCAAGNSGKDTDASPYYPASYDAANIISVAASNQRDQLAWFSNSGTLTTDVAAPGERIYSLANLALELWSDDFNDGLLDGWVTGGTNDEWNVSAPPGSSGPTALSTSPDGSNVDDADTWAQLPVQNLSNASATVMTFRYRSSHETNVNHLYLEISNDRKTWHNLALKINGTVQSGGIKGGPLYWTTAMADLGRWDGRGQVYLRLRFHSNTSVGGAGYYIDDIRLTHVAHSDNYQFMQGTSMATAYVSGLGALIQSEDPELGPLDIKFIIENSVDLNQNLLEMVGSGGRVNAHNALTLLRELSLEADMNGSSRVQLSWTSDLPLNGPITIERRTDDETEFSAIAEVSADVVNYLDDGVPSDGTYYYRVQTQSSEGDLRYSHQTVAGAVPTGGSRSSSGGGSGGGGCFIEMLGGQR